MSTVRSQDERHTESETLDATFDLACLAAFAFVASLGAARAELPLPADGGEAASVPMTVLSPGDVALYQQIFDAERAGHFDRAQELFGQVSRHIARRLCAR